MIPMTSYRKEISALKWRLRNLKRAVSIACAQIKRGEWNSHNSGTWQLLDTALKQARKRK